MIDPTPLREAIEAKITALMDLNQQITKILRDRARDFETIGTTYQALSMQAFSVADSIAELALIAAHNTGDIIVAEFGIGADDSEEDDDDDGLGEG
jgi:hypothetical protein